MLGIGFRVCVLAPPTREARRGTRPTHKPQTLLTKHNFPIDPLVHDFGYSAMKFVHLHVLFGKRWLFGTLMPKLDPATFAIETRVPKGTCSNNFSMGIAPLWHGRDAPAKLSHVPGGTRKGLGGTPVPHGNSHVVTL